MTASQPLCLSCGRDLLSCVCPLSFSMFTDMVRSVGIEEGASRMTVFFALPTAAQLEAWRNLRDKP